MPVPFPLDHLPRERVLRDAIAGAIAGEVTESAEAVVDGRTLAFTARPLAGGGAVVALLDLTATRRLEAVRRDFVANVSHELKTPLTVVGGFAETLTDEDLPADQRRQFAETILANTDGCSGSWMTCSICPASNPAVGSRSRRRSTCGRLAADAVVPSRAIASEKGVALEVCVPDDARTVTADATALRQILTNLVENAVRHTSTGSVTVATHREPGSTPSGHRHRRACG